jgi:hypothetical protein
MTTTELANDLVMAAVLEGKYDVWKFRSDLPLAHKIILDVIAKHQVGDLPELVALLPKDLGDSVAIWYRNSTGSRCDYNQSNHPD